MGRTADTYMYLSVGYEKFIKTTLEGMILNNVTSLATSLVERHINKHSMY